MQIDHNKTLRSALTLSFASALMMVVGCDAGAGAVALSLSQLDDRLATSPTRTEVELYPDSLVAREVHVEADELIIDEEYLESTVDAVASAGDMGTLTMALGGIAVSFDASTRFRMDGSADLSLTEFVDVIAAELDAGATPFVRAERASTGTAADPFDPTFVATEIRIENEIDDPKLEVVLGAENLDTSAAQAVIRVLGLEIEVNTDDGTTYIDDRSNEPVEIENEMEMEDGSNDD